MAHPLAGEKAPKDMLCDIPALVSSYYELEPDLSESSQRVSFGTSGHRGSSLDGSFNEKHILAITQAVCEYREKMGYAGPIYIGKDTHALSTPAQMSAVEVCVANGVSVRISDDYIPTPLVSFAILRHNEKGRERADGIVITPSHNPPGDGGFKYNPPNGGPADTDVTDWVQRRANDILEADMKGLRRVSYAEAIESPLVQKHDFVTPYVEALDEILDMEAIGRSGLKLCADALGGTAMAVYRQIASRYSLDMDILNDYADPTFSFMTLDHDGKIRMDCSSPFAMASLVAYKDRYDLAFANDTDADRHGIVTPVGGLMNPNHYLAVAIWYLFSHRKEWSGDLKIGKTLVSSSMIERVAADMGRDLYEVPVGFKWFVDGLYEGWLGFSGEESAGASFLKKDGGVWSTDKDGIVMTLLAAEIKAVTGRDPAEIYADFEERFGKSYYGRIDAAADAKEKRILKELEAQDIEADELGGEKITGIFTNAPGNGAPIGGLKLTTKNGWAAIRPSGTEDIYKIYAESFVSREHLGQVQNDAVEIVKKIFAKKG